MKKSMVLPTIVIVFSLLIQIYEGVAFAAYELDWVSIQHRVYDYKAGSNKLAFNLKDGSGNFVSDSNSVSSVILRYPQPNGDPDPSGAPVQIGTLVFEPPLDFIPARFDTDIAEWIYDPSYLLSEFGAEIEGTLVTGTYTLEVTTDDMVTHIKTINFAEILDLPAISYRTFQIHTDLSGNIHWTWRIPKQLLELAETYDLSVRAGVAAFENDVLTALFWPNIPIHMGFCFVPASTYNFLKTKGDKIGFGFQIRTNNNQSRAYTKRIDITDLNSPVSIIPKNSIVVVPLN